MPGEEGYYRDAENIHLDLSTVLTEVTINVPGSGTETATKKFLNKGSLGSGLVIRPDKTVELLQLGSKVFRNPIEISTEGLSWVRNIKDFSVIVVRNPTVTTQIKIMVL